ncbi:MAG: radical SAM protein [Lentisphaeria bacterium]|nr:MAG: radical SAM protein [Lentisphaeria bacterium]
MERAAEGRRLVVSGCLTEWDKAGDVKKKFPEVDLWTGVNQTAKLAELLDGGDAPAPAGSPCYLYDETTPRLQLTLPHLAYLKIADGCNNRCTYCSIPGIRGSLRSRSIASVTAEAKALIGNGVRELLVIAQDITAFGMDRPEAGENLQLLLEELNARRGFRHPAALHASGSLHGRADRFSGAAGYEGAALSRHSAPAHLRPDPAGDEPPRDQGGDRNAAFDAAAADSRPDAADHLHHRIPGESEEEFEELLAFARKFRFERCGVFPYSPEPGTPAAKLPDQIPAELAEARSTKLMKQQLSRMKRANRNLEGKEFRVLIDEIDDRVAIARGPMDAPEIDNVIIIPEPKRLHEGEFCRVRVIGAKGYDLIAEPVRIHTKGTTHA